MKRDRNFTKLNSKEVGFVQKNTSKEYKLIKSIDKLNYDELVSVSQVGKEYVKGLKHHATGIKKLDGLAHNIYAVSVNDRQRANKILEHIDSKIVKKNMTDVKVTVEAEQQLSELMSK